MGKVAETQTEQKTRFQKEITPKKSVFRSLRAAALKNPASRAAALENPAWGLCPQTPTNFLKKV